MLAPHDDIQFHYCQDATTAVQQAVQLRPTVILQDLVMPEIDGLTLVPQYREQSATHDTPLIVLSTREEADTKAQAFALGANDYLVKLPDPVELVARIRYHSRGYVALLERNEAYQALAASEKTLRDELSRAADYVRSLLPEPLEGQLSAQWRFIPSAALGGDAFDYQWIDEDHFAICLLDVCGHGVGPALLSVSVINSLRARTFPGADFCDPGSVLASVNRAYPMERQNFLFFTIWYGVYHRPSGELRYSGGGHPAALLRRKGNKLDPTTELLESPGPIMGMDEEAEFPTLVTSVSPEDALFVYSDGAFEIEKPDGEDWTFGEFVEFMETDTPDSMSKIDHLLQFIRALQQRDDFTDDFSIVRVQFP